MGIGISIFVIAVGAALRYALTAPIDQHGFNIHTGGMILMIFGSVGLLLSIVFWRNFASFGRRDSSVSRREETITHDGHEQGHVVSVTRDRVAS